MKDRRGILILPEEAGPYWADLIARSGLNLVGIHPAGEPARWKSSRTCWTS